MTAKCGPDAARTSRNPLITIADAVRGLKSVEALIDSAAVPFRPPMGADLGALPDRTSAAGHGDRMRI
jgi:hypothetical protein